MADIKYNPVYHDHEAFLKEAFKRKEFAKAYENLEGNYQLVREVLTRGDQDSQTIRKSDD
jgi:hypothetical protein